MLFLRQVTFECQDYMYGLTETPAEVLHKFQMINLHDCYCSKVWG